MGEYTVEFVKQKEKGRKNLKITAKVAHINRFLKKGKKQCFHTPGMLLEQQQICSVMSHLLSDSELIHWDIDLAQQK